MLDIQYIRENAAMVSEKSKQKGYSSDISKLIELDEKRRKLQTEIEQLRAQRNELASTLKSQKPNDEKLDEGRKLKDNISKLESLLAPIELAYYQLLKQVPNIPLDTVPIGSTEADNVIIKKVGSIPVFDFTVRSDAELGILWDLIDKDRAVKVAGTRFAYIKGGLVQLQFAIMQYVIHTLSNEHILKKLVRDNNLNITTTPFIPVLPPAVAMTHVYEATGRLNGEEQTYKLADDELWLNASAEHTLCPMYMNEIIPEESLPIRYIGFTTAFRREAGTYGKDAEGIFRMHQFDKLEMEVFSTPETGLAEHQLLVLIQEYLVHSLELPYEVIQKCTADIGKPNAQGIDINVWMPAQQAYRETHTADYMGDYQTRDLKTRVRRQNGLVDFVHTNDATAFALGRIMKAIMENYQTKEGHITIPNILIPYMNGREEI